MADPHAASVTLFCGFNNQPSIFPERAYDDVSLTPFAEYSPSAIGIDYENKKSGIGALSCSLYGGRIELPHNPSYSITAASNKVTIEFYVLRTTPSASVYIGKPGKLNVSYSNWGITVSSSGTVSFGLGISGYLYGAPLGGKTGTTVIPLGVWTHVAVVFDSTAARLYVGGHLDASYTPSQVPADNYPLGLYIGTEPGQPFSYSGCVLDDLRITTVARYTSDFTPENYGADRVLIEYPEITARPINGKAEWANPETREQAWPGETAAKPVPKQAPVLLWRATEPVLPVDAKLTLGFIRGTITSRSEAVGGRRVVCFGPSLDPVAETVSAADGSYRFDLLWLGREYLIMAMDNPAYQYNPAAADRRQPEVYS